MRKKEEQEEVGCGNKNTAPLTGLLVIATADGNYDFAVCDAVWFTGSRQEGGCFASRGTGLNLTGDMRPHSFKREWSPLSITVGKVFRKKKPNAGKSSVLGFFC